MSNKEVILLEKKLSPVIKEAQALVIATPEDMKGATEVLSRLNKFGDSITEEKEKVTKPLNEALKAERARWKPIETIYEEAISIVRNKMSIYQTEQVKRQREEEDKIAARIGEGKGKLKIETAVKKIEDIDRVDNKVNTDSGMVKFREDKILKIVNESKIPREYLVVDEKKVLEALRAGKTVAGAEIEIKMVPVNFR